MNTTPLFVLISVTLMGCATPRTAVIDGKEVLRPSLGYTDHDLFAVEIKRAWPQPRGASSGLRADGGHVWGRVCASDLQLDATYRGSRLDLSGILVSAWPSGSIAGSDRPVAFEARDHEGMREVIGTVGSNTLPLPVTANLGTHGSVTAVGGGAVGSNVIDFAYNRERLVGWIGFRHFNLHRDGDQYVGTYTELGEERPFVVDGVDEMWRMPAPAQMAVLPFLMTCAPLHAFDRGAAPPDPQLTISFRDRHVR